jgi:bifunctional non-homologous end joining protein LigD
MKAVLGELPTGPEWAYELKWDGMRLVAACDVGTGRPSRLTLRSARGNDVTTTFPELADLPAAVGISAVLDGEAVVFDGDGPSFSRLQNRMHVVQPSPQLVADHPVVYVLFDLLELDGRSLVELPYTTRRRLLRDLVDDGPRWRVPPHVDGDGGALLRLARQRGLEGIVAKRLDSPYHPGGRSRDWVKVKVRLRQELVVGGWLPGQGALAGKIGSLLVGFRDGDRLRFAGAVGSGLDDRYRRLLAGRLHARPNCPFDEVPVLLKPPSWVEPEVVVEVDYGSWPIDGLIRHPVLAGLRLDKDPADVVRELPPTGPDAR